MTRICAWCEHEGLSAAVPDTDAANVTYAICDAHAARLVAQLHKYYPPRRPIANVPETLSA
jgi:hypothetical protein